MWVAATATRARMKAKVESGEWWCPLAFLKFLGGFHAVSEREPEGRNGMVWFGCTCGLFTERGVCHHALAMGMETFRGQTEGGVEREDFKEEHLPAGVANADLFQKRGPGRPTTQQAIKDWVKQAWPNPA